MRRRWSRVVVVLGLLLSVALGPSASASGCTATGGGCSATSPPGRGSRTGTTRTGSRAGCSASGSTAGRTSGGWTCGAALRPFVAARLDECARKGFDGADPDNVDGYRHDTGFPITARHQLRFNRMVARMAHRRGLTVALKNDLGQVRRLEPYFDLAVNEQCAQYRECHRLRPFLRAGKPVLHVEYDLPRRSFCAQSRRLGLSSVRKNLRLDAPRHPC